MVQYFAYKAMFVLLEGLVIMKGMFRCASMEHGDMSVTISGEQMMPKLSAHNWDIQNQVRIIIMMIMIMQHH